jgi:hypothetical protein
MTYAKRKDTLTKTEYDEMVALKNAINDNPASVCPDKQEEFAEYLVRSLRERGG